MIINILLCRQTVEDIEMDACEAYGHFPLKQQPQFTPSEPEYAVIS